MLAIDHDRWQAMAHAPSPHWRAIRAQAIATATAVLAWVERLDLENG